ncbi:uncharacterized protein AB675_2068 [Cyphellophora attinorum]|uniref:Cryptic loci regulator 2 N-terminal domain-containing protein n=1 Tax=Cyphellophora attinorum TaxID=1664694 RepID=A0A0N1HDS3_9EURO|nr:uncharacterized protein AB675_2068 [Phialophora attinorum]KPI42895.1 hypothetical protein AB675_2068 [Phialophora attinorum]
MSRLAFRPASKPDGWEELKLEPYTDGDPNKWPQHPYRTSDSSNYQKDLAAAWKGRVGVYWLEKLPDGYGVFETDQPGGPQTYKRLFGHPSGRFYDSIKKFTPHFLWLMGGKQGSCECHMCSRNNKAPVIPRPRRPRELIDTSLLSRRRQASGTGDEDMSDNAPRSRRARREVKSAGAPDVVDEEGTEDVYKKFVMRLYAAKDASRGIDDDIVELNSLDWRAEHDEESDAFPSLLPGMLRQLEHQPSFIPRMGEVVLWVPDFLDGHYLIEDKKDGITKFFSYEHRRFSAVPQWRAGVITAVPNADLENGQVDFQDILQLPKKTTDLNRSGFRVETLPDPNDLEGKSVSKQYKYVPLRSVRPLSQWQSVLRGIDPAKLHRSISNALTTCTSFTLVEKLKCTGQWPNGIIHCKAIYLGPELITTGDTVRLSSPMSPARCTQVLKLESVRLHLDDMKEEHGKKESPGLASRIWVSFVGKAYSRNFREHYEFQTGAEDSPLPAPISKYEAKEIFEAVGVVDYGPWYPMHHPGLRFEVSLEQVLGRLHEPKAVRLWNGEIRRSRRRSEKQQKPQLNYDTEAIISARQCSTRMDRRTPRPEGDDILWYWADTRALALGVESFNGLEVDNYWEVRDKTTLNLWHNQLKILNGVQVLPGIDNQFVQIPGLPGERRGRKKGSKVINGKLVNPGDPEYDAVYGEGHAGSDESKPKPSSQMAGAAMASTDEESNDDEEDADEQRGADLSTWMQPAPKWKLVDSDDDIQMLEPVPGASAARPPQRSMSGAAVNHGSKGEVKKAPLSKAEIMEGEAMPSIEDYDDVTSESEDDWDHVPPARGGTEETEGGDYDPRKEALHRGRRSVSD